MAGLVAGLPADETEWTAEHRLRSSPEVLHSDGLLGECTNRDQLITIARNRRSPSPESPPEQHTRGFLRFHASLLANLDSSESLPKGLKVENL
jgi:hypothetical protein